MSLKERNSILKELRARGHIIPRNIKLPELRQILHGQESTTTTEEITVAATEEAERPKRKERVPLGSYRPKLDFEAFKEKGYSYRLMRGTVGRLQDAEQGGWEFVLNEDGTKVKARVGEFEDGSAREDFLMKIDEELYQEDQEAKQKEVDKVDDAIKTGSLGRQSDDGRYVPDGGIQYETHKT